jgi:ribosomal protein S18 acetylase RimI-like enzyme
MSFAAWAKLTERDRVCSQGVATALIGSAAGHAWAGGVTDLYVHVASSNAAARQLYVQRCGFDVEQRELEAVARGMGRPARLLLHRAAPPGQATSD